jgi:ABC-type transport system involved in cytochrome c biogenesis permease subunit
MKKISDILEDGLFFIVKKILPLISAVVGALLTVYIALFIIGAILINAYKHPKAAGIIVLIIAVIISIMYYAEKTDKTLYYKNDQDEFN